MGITGAAYVLLSRENLRGKIRILSNSQAAIKAIKAYYRSKKM